MNSQVTQPVTDPSAYRLIVEEVKLWRDQTIILKNINWQVKPGEHWALLGANGSGKTSLVMAIAGYMPFGEGRIYLLDGWIGRIHLQEQRKRIGIVSQSLSEYMAENVYNIKTIDVILTGLFGSLRLYDEVTTAERRRALDILTELGLEELADRPFQVLSSGQRQSCMLARSKMARNELVILDEPCASLDFGARERFLMSLEATINSDDAPTALFITHHPEEIVSAITHVLLLREGAMVAAGPKAEVMTADLLAQTFDLPLQVSPNNGRYWVQAAHLDNSKT
jgi:iron complex transport system ATP-binding protein